MNSISESSLSKTELNSAIQHLLDALKELTFAHSVCLFWVKNETQQLLIEAKSTNAQSFSSSFRFSLGQDLVSQIATNGKPLIITNINPSAQRDLFCYYDANENVKSFAGVPIFFSQNNSPVAILCADSLSVDDFGNETLNSLQNFGGIISSLLKNYTEKYDLQIDAKLLNAIRTMQSEIFSNNSTQSIYDSLLREISKILSWNFLTIVTKDKNDNVWKLQNVLNNTTQRYAETARTIEIQNSLVGKSLQANRSIIINSLSEQNLIRFYKDESLSPHGSFLCIPLSNDENCFAILTAEFQEASAYTQKDIQTLQPLLSFVTTQLEILEAKQKIKEEVQKENLTNALREKFFFQQLENELQRANAFNENCTLAIFSIDRAQKLKDRFEENGFNIIRKSIANVIQNTIRSFDVFGMSEEFRERFFVLLVHSSSTDAQLWGEKVRKQIASTIISLEEKTFSATTSIGIYCITKPMNGEFAFSYAKTALNKAIEQGENSVKIL